MWRHSFASRTFIPKHYENASGTRGRARWGKIQYLWDWMSQRFRWKRQNMMSYVCRQVEETPNPQVKQTLICHDDIHLRVDSDAALHWHQHVVQIYTDQHQDIGVHQPLTISNAIIVIAVKGEKSLFKMRVLISFCDRSNLINFIFLLWAQVITLRLRWHLEFHTEFHDSGKTTALTVFVVGKTITESLLQL